MASPPGRLSGVVKLPVQVRMFPEEMEAVDAFAAELSQQSYGAAFSRAEALRIAAMEWLKERQARRARVPISPSLSAPEAERGVPEEVTPVPAPSSPAAPAPVEPRTHEAAAAAEDATMMAPPSPPKRPGRARAGHSARALRCWPSLPRLVPRASHGPRLSKPRSWQAARLTALCMGCGSTARSDASP